VIIGFLRDEEHFVNACHAIEKIALTCGKKLNNYVKGKEENEEVKEETEEEEENNVDKVLRIQHSDEFVKYINNKQVSDVKFLVEGREIHACRQACCFFLFLLIIFSFSLVVLCCGLNVAFFFQVDSCCTLDVLQ